MKDFDLQIEKYASEKALSFITDSIVQAYNDGVDCGYSKAREGVAIEFVDLGLKSGTLWSASPLKCNDGGANLCLAYEDAVQFSIPTEDQWDELRNDCTWQYQWDNDNRQLSVVRCTGPNGNSITFNYEGYTTHFPNSFYFWLNSDKTANSNRGYGHAAAIGHGCVHTNSEKLSFLFPVRLVIRGKLPEF